MTTIVPYTLQRDFVWRAVAIVALNSVTGCERSAPPQRSAAESRDRVPTATKTTNPPDVQQFETDLIDPTISARMSAEPKKIAPGDQVLLIVQLKIQPGWHIAPMANITGPVKSTLLSLNLPTGVQSIGDWEKPPSTTLFDGRANSVGYVGNVRFSHELAVDAGVPTGPVELDCRLSYQACNESICQRPAELNLRAKIEIVRQPAENRSK